MDNYSNKKFNNNKKSPRGGSRPGYGAKPPRRPGVDRRPGGDMPAAAPENIVSGRNSVRELLKSGRSVDKSLSAQGIGKDRLP